MQRLNNSVHSINILNSSTSKQRYSFPKSSRFSLHRSSQNDAFYNVPSSQSKRSTSFGYGNKDIGVRYQKVWPSPEAYNISSEFNNKSKKGFSFGEGRQDMELTGPLSESIYKRYIPSPNLYNPKKQQKPSSITLKSRIQDKSLQKLKKLPGPGSYNIQQIGSSNYYLTSNHQNHINYRISKTPRVMSFTNHRPDTNLGPGSYDLKSTQLNREGSYIISKDKSSLAQRFSKGTRPSPVIQHLLTTPGPTQYQKYSDFGN